MNTGFHLLALLLLASCGDPPSRCWKAGSPVDGVSVPAEPISWKVQWNDRGDDFNAGVPPSELTHRWLHPDDAVVTELDTSDGPCRPGRYISGDVEVLVGDTFRAEGGMTARLPESGEVRSAMPFFELVPLTSYDSRFEEAAQALSPTTKDYTRAEILLEDDRENDEIYVQVWLHGTVVETGGVIRATLAAGKATLVGE